MLTPTDIYATVVWLGVVRNREATLEAEPVETMRLTWEGAEGECHGGLTRPSCTRVKLQYPKGTEIRNTRQLTILSAEELEEVAAAMGIPAIRPEWVGASIVLAGVPQFTRVPPASRLIFEGGASIAVDMENGPCKYPAEVIERHHPGLGMSFPKHAMGKRGVTAWVERPGTLRAGAVGRLHVPPQKLYAPAMKRAAE